MKDIASLEGFLSESRHDEVVRSLSMAMLAPGTIAAYNAFIDLVSIYDGYASENDVVTDDRYWGDMVTLNKEIDSVTAVSGEAEIKAHWPAIVAVAKKVLDGVDGLMAERGIGRYGKASVVTRAKTLFK